MSGRGRRFSRYGLLWFCAVSLWGQIQPARPQHESVVVNIEVPVRVFKNGVFVDGLTLADFEVFENGVVQPIEAVYLIKDRKILREEKAPGASPPGPQKNRHYVLYMELKEYIPKIGEALDYFVKNILGRDDSFYFVTPVRTYMFQPQDIARLPRQELSGRLKALLKQDTQAGYAQYRRLVREFYQLLEDDFPGEDASFKEIKLFDLARQMRDQTDINENEIKRFADILKSLKGEKHVFLMLQRYVLPAHEFTFDILGQLLKPVAFDVNNIKRYFSDASITVHCLYITKIPSFIDKPMLQTGSIRESLVQDLSSNIYASFREIADATGGLSESTTNPKFAIREAGTASSNYYVLYYRPLEYRADGRFREIEVRIKGRRLTVTHRMGYIAD